MSYRSSHWSCSLKKRWCYKFRKTHRKTPVPETEACNFIKKETLAHVFSCKFCEISKGAFFTDHLCTTASGHIKPKLYLWTKLHKNLLFAKYLTSVAVTLKLFFLLPININLKQHSTFVLNLCMIFILSCFTRNKKHPTFKQTRLEKLYMLAFAS